jgi:hypothetical protein
MLDIYILNRHYTARLNILGELELFDDDGQLADPATYDEVDEWAITQEILYG